MGEWQTYIRGDSLSRSLSGVDGLMKKNRAGRQVKSATAKTGLNGGGVFIERLKSEISGNRKIRSGQRPETGARKKMEIDRYFPGLKSVDVPVRNRRGEEYRKIFQAAGKDGKISTSRFSSEAEIREEIKSSPDKKKLYDTAVEFQAIFLNMLLKSMRSTLNRKDDPLYGGQSQEIFEDMLYDEYAKTMSKNGHFKLADQLYRELSSGM